MRAGPSVELASPVLLAAVLTAEGAGPLVVGSAALWLQGVDLPVGDLDIVPDLNGTQIESLREAIGCYRCRPRKPPSVPAMLAVDIWSATTLYGKVDVLVERARHQGRVLRGRATTVRVLDVDVLVASANDAWALRRRFKKPGRDELSELA